MNLFKKFSKKMGFLALLCTLGLISSVSAAPGLLQSGANVFIKGVDLQDVEVLVGTVNINALQFEATASEDVQAMGLLFQGNQFFDEKHIKTLRLRQNTSSGWDEISVMPGTLIENNMLIWNASYGDLFIDAYEPSQFLLTVDIVDNDNLVGDYISVNLRKAKMMSLQGGSATVYGLPVSSNNTIYLVNNGIVKIWPQNISDQYINVGSDDITLTKFKVIAEEDAVIEDLLFLGQSNFDTSHLENVELIFTNYAGYAIHYQVDSFANNEAFFQDLDIELDAGVIYTLRLCADIVDDPNLAGDEIRVGLEDAVIVNISSGEDADIYGVPYQPANTVFIVLKEIKVYGLPLLDVGVIAGTEGVDAVKFTVKTDDFSVEVDEMLFMGNENFDEDHISAIKLWKQTVNGREALEEQLPFDINNNTIRFDDLGDVYIPANNAQDFLLTLDISYDPTNVGDIISAQLIDLEATDDDNDEVSVLGLPVDSGRDITIMGVGELYVSVDNTDSATYYPKHVLGSTEFQGGTEPVFVASFELEAINEPIEVEDMILEVTGPGMSDFADAITEVKIYDDDMVTVLYQKVVNSSTVYLNNIDLLVEEGTENIYITVVADTIGYNENGTEMEDVYMNLSISDAEGVNSGGDVEVTYDSGNNSMSNPSLGFDVVPVYINDFSGETSAYGITIDTTISDGFNQTVVLLSTATDTWDNTTSSGDDLELLLNKLTVENTMPGNVTNLRIRRLDIAGSPYVAGVEIGDTVVFDFTTWTYPDRLIDELDTAYFEIIADIDFNGQGGSFSVNMIDLQNGGFVYSSNESSYSDITSLRAGSGGNDTIMGYTIIVE